MVTAQCIKKIRDKNNAIKQYIIQDFNGNQLTISSDNLKIALFSKQIEITNLTLSKDGRLIDKNIGTNTQSNNANIQSNDVDLYTRLKQLIKKYKVKEENENNLYSFAWELVDTLGINRDRVHVETLKDFETGEDVCRLYIGKYVTAITNSGCADKDYYIGYEDYYMSDDKKIKAFIEHIKKYQKCINYSGKESSYELFNLLIKMIEKCIGNKNKRTVVYDIDRCAVIAGYILDNQAEYRRILNAKGRYGIQNIKFDVSLFRVAISGYVDIHDGSFDVELETPKDISFSYQDGNLLVRENDSDFENYKLRSRNDILTLGNIIKSKYSYIFNSIDTYCNMGADRILDDFFAVTHDKDNEYNIIKYI